MNEAAGQNSTVIGMHSKAMADDCFVIGDNVECHEVGGVVIGDELFGEPIPDSVKQVLLDNPDEVTWLLKAIVEGITNAYSPRLERLRMLYRIEQGNSEVTDEMMRQLS